MNKIQKFRLPNGLRLLIYEDHKLPLVSMTACFRGGLLAEDIMTNGLTYLLKKTIVKGTRTKSAAQIAQILEQVGGTMEGIGCQCGCSSRSRDNDSFSITVDVMKPHLRLGLELLAEVLIEPTFPKIEVEREKKKQLSAIRTKDDHIRNVASKLLQENLFGTHPYARQAIGRAESVSAFTSDMLQAFHKEYVVGHNGVVAIFGAVKIEEAFAIASKVFESMPSGVLAFQDVPSVMPLIAPLHKEFVQPREQALVIKGFQGVGVNHPDALKLEILEVLCSSFGSRLFKEIREKLALVYYIYGLNSMKLASGSFDFYLGVDPKKSAVALGELNKSIHQLINEGLTLKELDEAKKKLITNESLAHQKNSAFGADVANDELMGLGFDHTYHRLEKINNVTLKQMNDVIKKYLDVLGFVEVIVGPE